MIRKISIIFTALSASLMLAGCAKHNENTTSGIEYSKKAKSPSKQDDSSTNTSSQPNDQANSSSSSTSNVDNISTDDWLLMGYMSYARKNYEQSENVSSTAEMVEAVASDIENDKLTVTQNGPNSISLENHFGGVDVSENNEEIKVTGDGTSSFSKDQLKDKYAAYMGQIEDMTKHIGQAKSNNDDTEFSTKELVTACFIQSNRNGKTAREKIDHVEKRLAAGVNVPNDGYLTGLYKEHGKYSAAYNISTSQYIVFTFNGDDIEGSSHSVGADPIITHYSKAKIEKDYGPYRAELSKILQGLEYNKKHMDDFRK